MCTAPDKQTKQRTRAPHQKYLFLKSTPNIWVYFVFFHRGLFRRLWWPRAARAKGSGQSKVQLQTANINQTLTISFRQPSVQVSSVLPEFPQSPRHLQLPVHLTRCSRTLRARLVAPLVAPLVAARGAREGLWSE